MFMKYKVLIFTKSIRFHALGMRAIDFSHKNTPKMLDFGKKFPTSKPCHLRSLIRSSTVFFYIKKPTPSAVIKATRAFLQFVVVTVTSTPQRLGVVVTAAAQLAYVVSLTTKLFSYSINV
jgi:hypothetical protein